MGCPSATRRGGSIRRSTLSRPAYTIASNYIRLPITTPLYEGLQFVVATVMAPTLLDGFPVHDSPWDEGKGGGGIVSPHLDTIDCGFTGTQRHQADDRCLGIWSAEMYPYPIKTTQIRFLSVVGIRLGTQTA